MAKTRNDSSSKKVLKFAEFNLRRNLIIDAAWSHELRSAKVTTGDIVLFESATRIKKFNEVNDKALESLFNNKDEL